MDGIPGREKMAGVHADGYAVFVIDKINDAAQLLEPVAECCALSRRGLQCAEGVKVPGQLVDGIQRFGNAFDPFVFAGTNVSAWVNDECCDAEHLATAKFVQESLTGLLTDGRVRGAKI